MTEQPPWATVPEPLNQFGRQRGLLTAEVAIVGAGLTGLSTALHLLERSPGLDVLVADARAVASGASGRGTGLLGPRIGPPVETARRRFGDETTRLMYEVSVAAVATVTDVAGRHGIACDLRPGPQYVMARRGRGAQLLARRARAYADLGLDVPAVSRVDDVDVPYAGGLRYGPAATLDPAALTHGLAAAVRRLGGRILTGYPVERVERGRLRMAATEVLAQTVVVAANGYAPALGLKVGTLLPLDVHAVATAPLGPAARAALGGETGCAVIEAGEMSPAYRLTGDGRLVVGGGRALMSAGPDIRARSTGHGTATGAGAWGFLETWLRRLHPVLRDVPVTHRWSGRIAMTGDGLPVLGQVPDMPGVWFAGGCCGHGLALSVASGAYLADAIVGTPGPALPWHRGRGPWVPVGGVARPFLRGYLAVLAARAERAALRGAARAERNTSLDRLESQ